MFMFLWVHVSRFLDFFFSPVMEIETHTREVYVSAFIYYR